MTGRCRGGQRALTGREGAGCSRLRPDFPAEAELGPSITPGWVGWVFGLVPAVSGGWGHIPAPPARCNLMGFPPPSHVSVAR